MQNTERDLNRDTDIDQLIRARGIVTTVAEARAMRSSGKLSQQIVLRLDGLHNNTIAFTMWGEQCNTLQVGDHIEVAMNPEAREARGTDTQRFVCYLNCRELKILDRGARA